MKKDQKKRFHCEENKWTNFFTVTRAIAGAALLGCSASVTADVLTGWSHPAVQIAYGRDTKHNIGKYELGVNFNTPVQIGNPGGWLFRLQAEVNAAGWDARGGTNTSGLAEFGLSPIIRIEKRGGYFVPFVEGSLGIRILSHARTSDQHRMSSAFQFSDMVGVGVGFGKNSATEAGFRFQHISNAGIKEPNPGSNFYTAYVRYRF
ncbi:acyloxyacyl hydrolase [Burkholderia ubonensis]|uniref:acyloxyacyl hydrolase n=1 Tax=Burkholderia ubonensis TaxID=101571 RepID=UPI0009B37E15|nr:acyloxyacyl hydrolase [Burkholderia ubonensis]